MGVKHVNDWFQRRHTELHQRRWMLDFDDVAAERAFTEYDDAAGLRLARFAIAVALLLHLGYAVAEPFLFETHLGEATLIRVITGLGPFATAGLVVTRWPQWAQRHLQSGLFVLAGMSMAGFAIAAHATPFPTPYVQNALAITLLGVIGITRIRLHAALGLAACYAVASGFVAVARSDADTLFASHVAPATGLTVVGIVMGYALERLRRSDYLSQREAEFERDLSDDLLHSILPAPIADRLRSEREAIAESAPSVSVLFSDIVGFTPLSETLSPEELVHLLDTLFSEFDELCEERGVEKIKTIGDAYMAVAGIPNPDPDHAASLADLALAMQRTVADLSADWPHQLTVRIGISSGPVVAGVIGQRKFAYDLWGDTVNTASRMESHGEPGRIQVSEPTYLLLQDRFTFTGPHRVPVKGKGDLVTHYLDAPRP